VNVLLRAQNDPLKKPLRIGFSQQVSAIQLQNIENDGTGKPFLIPLNRAVDGTKFVLGKPKSAHEKKDNFLSRVIASEPVQGTPVRGGEPTLGFPGALLNIFAVLKGAVPEQRSLINIGIGFQGGKESRVAQGGSSCDESGTSGEELNRTPKVLENFTSFDKFSKFNSVDGAVGRGREPEEETVNSEFIEKKIESLNLTLRRNVYVDIRAREDPRRTRRREANEAPIRTNGI